LPAVESAVDAALRPTLNAAKWPTFVGSDYTAVYPTECAANCSAKFATINATKPTAFYAAILCAEFSTNNAAQCST